MIIMHHRGLFRVKLIIVMNIIVLFNLNDSIIENLIMCKGKKDSSLGQFVLFLGELILTIFMMTFFKLKFTDNNAKIEASFVRNQNR